jgi:uncharacterized membrane protein
MNVPHLHLLLNHFPTVGTVIGLGLLLLSFVRKNDHLKQVSFEVFWVISLLAIPAYLSGSAAQAAIAGLPDVSEPLVTAHQDAAVVALLFMELTGVVAWLALWQLRREGRLAGWSLPSVFFLAAITLALMASTATLGGEIRHEEIRTAQQEAAETAEETAGTAAGWLEARSLASFVSSYTWVWPASETLHFIGLCLVMGVVLLVNLRMLGMMKNIPFSALHRLLPWAIVGFAINTVTGFLFFVAAADQYTLNIAFYWKMGFIFLAGLNVLYLTVFDGPWAVGRGDDASAGDKAMAASALFLWFGVICWGRLLPFLGLSF